MEVLFVENHGEYEDQKLFYKNIASLFDLCVLHDNIVFN